MSKGGMVDNTGTINSAMKKGLQRTIRGTQHMPHVEEADNGHHTGEDTTSLEETTNRQDRH